MPTNKIALRTTSEVMSDYQPRYQPIYPLLMGNSQQFSEDVGQVEFRRVTTVGDIRAHHYTPKDTVIRQIAVSEGKKTFKKYFLANQYIESTLQTREDLETTVGEVLDEHQKQADELVLFGEGTAANNVANNGLYWSGDSNYTLEESTEIDPTTDNGLIEFHNAIMTDVAKANSLAGRKLLLFYGTAATSRFNGLYSTNVTPFKRVLSDVLNGGGGNGQYTFAEMPTDITPAASHGYMIINLDRIRLLYVKLPGLMDQGVNDEKLYAWFNFLMGSFMVDVTTKNGIIRRPITIAA